MLQKQYKTNCSQPLTVTVTPPFSLRSLFESSLVSRLNMNINNITKMIPARTAVSKREEVKPRRRGSRTMFVSTALELEHGGGRGPAALTLHDRRRRGGDGGNPIPCLDQFK